MSPSRGLELYVFRNVFYAHGRLYIPGIVHRLFVGLACR